MKYQFFGVSQHITLIAPNGGLLRTVLAASRGVRLESVRFRTLSHALDKAAPDAVPFCLIEWAADQVPCGILELETKQKKGRFFRSAVYCPDLPAMDATRGEEIRFALLEAGVVAVWGSARELVQLMPILKRHAEQFPAPSKHWITGIEELFPWTIRSTTDGSEREASST